MEVKKMPEQKSVQKGEETNELFREKIETRNPATDDLKEIFQVALMPYSMTDEKSGKTYKGTTLQITKTKFSFVGSKKSFISLDPANKTQRDLILKAYAEFDKIQKK